MEGAFYVEAVATRQRRQVVSRGIQRQGTIYFPQGVVGWGLPMFITMTFIFPELAGSAGDCPTISSLLRASRLGSGGALFGWSLWFFSMRKYGVAREDGSNGVVEER